MGSESEVQIGLRLATGLSKPLQLLTFMSALWPGACLVEFAGGLYVACLVDEGMGCSLRPSSLPPAAMLLWGSRIGMIAGAAEEKFP